MKAIDRKKILAIGGPTATGKTDMALNLAKRFSGELVSCDSRQVFKGLDLGTGKLPGGEVEYKRYDGYWEMDGIKVWMLDIEDPKKSYDVTRYVVDASRIINKLLLAGKLPIIVGGTGLYLKALLYGLPDSSFKVDRLLRGELEKLSLNQIQQKIISLSPTLFNSLNNSEQNNKRRLIRHIEKLTVGKKHQNVDKELSADILIIGLTCPKDKLNKRVDERVDKRVKLGMVEETQQLYKEKKLTLKRMNELGLEYKIIAEYLKGDLSLEEMIRRLKIKIHQYAKRQLTWFKKQPSINWFNIGELFWEKEVELRVRNWYNLGK